MASKSARRAQHQDLDEERGWSGLKIGLAVGIPVGVIVLIVVVIIIANSQQTPNAQQSPSPPPSPPPVAGPVKPSVSPTPAVINDIKDKPSPKEPSKEAKDKQEALYAEAQDAAAKMKYNSAIRLCSTGISSAMFVRDKSSRWHKLRASCYLATGKHALAADDIGSVIEIDGPSHELHFERAVAHGQARQFKEALADLDAALTLGGDKKILTQALLDFGDVQINKYADLPLALSAFTVAIKHNPKDEKLWLIRARHRADDPAVTALAAAQADFRMALKLNPKVKDTEKALAARLKIEDDD